MEESIYNLWMSFGFIVAAAILGYVLGNHRGYRSGYDNGVAIIGHTQNTNEALLSEYRSKFERYQCSRKFFVRSSWDVEDLELASTSHVKMMSDSLAQMLIDNKVVRPYVLSREPEGDGEVWNVVISLYCAKDPADAEYDSMPFIRLPSQK